MVRKVLFNILLFAVVVGGWHLYTVLGEVPTYVLPSPVVVGEKMLWLAERGELQRHVGATVKEILLGIGCGTVLGLVSGYVLGKSKTLEAALAPYLLIAQTAPKVSLAPLFILWFGLGLTSKVLLVTLVVFFPIMINTIVSLRSIDPRLRELVRMLKGSRWQAFWHLEAPASLAAFLAGLRIASTQSVVAAIIGEMMGSQAGLGHLLALGHETYDITLAMAALIVMSLFGLVFYVLVQRIERRVLSWAE